jgi:hypothetical protein
MEKFADPSLWKNIDADFVKVLDDIDNLDVDMIKRIKALPSKGPPIPDAPAKVAAATKTAKFKEMAKLINDNKKLFAAALGGLSLSAYLAVMAIKGYSPAEAISKLAKAAGSVAGEIAKGAGEVAADASGNFIKELFKSIFGENAEIMMYAIPVVAVLILFK